MFRSPSHFFAHHYGEPDDLARIAAGAVATQAAIEALGSGDTDLAERLWASVDGEALLEMWNRWNAVMDERGPQWVDDDTPEWVPPTPRKLSASSLRKAYVRDGHRCRYCGIPVFTKRKGDPVVALVEAFPGLSPGLTSANGSLHGSGSNGALCNVDYAKFLWSFASPDHVEPLSRGGADDLNNVVTSCSGCNYSKWDLTLAQIDVFDPRRVEPITVR